MKNKKTLILLVLSVVLSVGIIRTRNENIGAYPCSPGESYCINNGIGVRAITKQGYPLTYREKQVFYPHDNTAISSYTTEIDGYSLPRLLTSIVFWYGLLFTAYNLYETHKNKGTKKTVVVRKKK